MAVIQNGNVEGSNSKSQCQDAEEEVGLKKLLELKLESGGDWIWG